MSRHPETANIFELDPGLTRLLQGRRGEELRARGRVITYRLPRGDIDFEWLSRVRGWGLMILDGFFTRQMRLAERSSIELHGKGDVLRPWDEPHDLGPVPVKATWRSVTDSRIAVLDARFAAAVAGYPEVTEALAGRLLQTSWSSSLLALVSRLSWTEARILVLFWHLADRWGGVLPSGEVDLPLRLTHAEIGELVGTTRPTATMAVNHLIRVRAISRRDGGWILHGAPPTPADLEREALAAAFRVRRRHEDA